MNKPLDRIFRSAALLLLLAGQPVQALPGDSTAPLTLEADEADIDDKRGISVYRGGVVVTRGSIHITGDEITLHTPSGGGEIERAIILGRPATYRSRPKADAEPIDARGARIEYFGHEEKVILTGGAKVTQRNNVFSAERLVYDIRNDVVKGGGSGGGATEGGSGGKKERVRIIFHPKTESP